MYVYIGNNGNWSYNVDDTGPSTETSMASPQNQWQHVSWIMNGKDCQLFINAIAANSVEPYDSYSMIRNIVLGNVNETGPPGNQGWIGRIDEFWLHNTARSQNWLKTSYNTMTNTTTFIDISSEETQLL